MTNEWPDGLPVSQVRVARPTDRLDEVVRFYSEGLGLKIVGSFRDHEGYSGYMLGLPGRDYHLEFTQHAAGSPCPAPSRDNLLVFILKTNPLSTELRLDFPRSGIMRSKPRILTGRKKASRSKIRTAGESC
jgi:YycE-like protein